MTPEAWEALTSIASIAGVVIIFWIMMRAGS